ncbi:RDD family membrane protein [Aliarcobacter faecis]|uniref:RDD family protein n=1 Tax=Aliarcobacter faecis TaxID=1564138 RepID=UPI00047B5F6C|nr:RDD family protein [Aliarcobacter faecis]QKF72278.1 RDD family membrane protein [Aliarcobacter faecis]
MAKWRDVKQNRIKKSDEKSIKQALKSNGFATLGKRLKAFLIDLFLVTTPIFYIVIYFIMGGGEGFAQNRILGWSIILIVVFLILISLWLKNGQTPGLKAYGIKLVDKTTKEKINFFQALIRYFATLFSIILIVPLFYPFFNKEKKTVQDILSSTIIIDEE